MKGELLYAYSPVRWRIMWGVLYTLLLVVGAVAIYSIENRIGTHAIPVGDVKLVIPYSKYLVGESISFTVHNKFNSSVYVTNSCPSEPLNVFRLEKGTWKRLHDVASLKDCNSQLRQIAVPANGSTSGTFDAWHHLFNKPGKYRVVAHVDYYNALPYQDFEIIAKPQIPKPAQTPAIPRSSNGVSSATDDSTKPSSPAASGQSTQAQKSKTITTSGGTIRVQYDNKFVYVISVTPAAGYAYKGGGSGSEVEVTFKGANEIQVQMTVINGQLIVHTESESGD